MSEIDPEFMAAIDWLLTKKYPEHIGHRIQPLTVDGALYKFDCQSCGTWSAPVTLVLTMIELHNRIGKVAKRGQ